MSRHALVPVAVACGFFAALAVANEPLWTDAQRAERSAVVLVGKVLSVERAAKLDEREDLYRAVVAIESVSKGDAGVARAEEQIALYFEHPKDGDTGKRCPTYVSLKVDQRAQFYVRLRKVGPEWRAFLEMGSDVREPPAKPHGV